MLHRYVGDLARRVVAADRIPPAMCAMGIVGRDQGRTVVFLDGRERQRAHGVIGRHGILPVLGVLQVEVGIVGVAVGAVRGLGRDIAVGVIGVGRLRDGR